MQAVDIDNGAFVIKFECSINTDNDEYERDAMKNQKDQLFSIPFLGEMICNLQ